MLERADTLLVVVDVQEKLCPAIHQAAALVENVSRLVRGCNVLDLPAIHTEQNPAGLGRTVAALACDLPTQAVIKMSFSGCGEKAFVDAVAAAGRQQILLCGIETHVCVYQTAMDLVAAGYAVHVVADAVGSRTEANRAIGLEKIKDGGCRITSVETALFELLKIAGGETFKAILKIVK